MADKPRPTIIDYMAVAISPALIMLLVGSLTFFLLELMYSGEYSDRLRWILFWFVLAMVLISRIAMERGAGAAGMYGLLMAGAVGLAMSRFVDQVYGAWILLAVIWWCAHKLTWDCTLIDDSQDASGEGLLRVAGIEQQLAVNAATEAAATDPSHPEKKRSRLMAAVEARELAAAAAAAEPVVKKKKSRAHANWIERWLSGEQTAKRAHTPGLWVVYFSLAALPLFGIGQLRIPATDTVARDYAFRLLMVYVAAAMGLLLTTSFLGLRRYLRQRNMEMSTGIAGNWLTIGSGLLITILFISLLLPRPAAQYSINGLVDTASEKLVAASAWAFPGGSGGTGDGADGGEPTENGADADQSDDNQNAAAAKQPGGNQNGDAPGDNRGQPGDAGKSGQAGGDQGDAKGSGQDPGQGQGENGPNQSGQNDGQNSDQNNNDSKSGGDQDKSSANDSSSGKGQDAGKDSDMGDAGGKSGSSQSAEKSPSDQSPSGKEGGKNQPDSPKDGNDRAGETGKQREPGDDKQGEKQQQDPKQQQLQEQQRQDQQRLNQLRQRIAQKQRDKQRPGQQQPQNANAQVKRRPPTAQTPPKLTPQSINNSLPTGLQALFKFLLWIVILAIILAVAWYCWPGMAAFFQQVWRELQQWWAWLTGQRNRPNQSAAAVTQIEEEPPIPFADFANPFAGAGGKWTPGKLTAHTFDALQAWGREQGLERSADETPIEYADRLRAGLRECPAELMEFVQTYGRVAYARETPQRAQIDGMERLWRFMQRTADQNLARRTAVVSS